MLSFLVDADVDVIVFHCTAVPTFAPDLASNQSTVWQLLRSNGADIILVALLDCSHSPGGRA
ncbi:hypothetical protein [Bradyrhizobium elkanii]|uniref:hypothetical protein n=1 Tax=Bradyrhizobium elkanii TaxID=29448 RepID=UPI001BA52DDC|nr:hypothetical protein [Bradyrhizobium elkanii]MBR1159687.1 hypothetical protein [Bradyrhizobium elkanii]